MTGKTVINNY